MFHRKYLRNIAGPLNYVNSDFLEYGTDDVGYMYDRIIANPPFSKNQDIDHIRNMYECLKPSGRIVTFSSLHWIEGNEKKCKDFREWITKLDYKTIDVERGAFKESGTQIATCIIVINK